MTVTGRDGKVVEVDTFTCCHCQHIVAVPPKANPADMGGWCAMCHAPHCGKGPCAAGVCRPFERWLDRMEGTRRFREFLDKEYGPPGER